MYGITPLPTTDPNWSAFHLLLFGAYLMLMFDR